MASLFKRLLALSISILAVNSTFIPRTDEGSSTLSGILDPNISLSFKEVSVEPKLCYMRNKLTNARRTSAKRLQESSPTPDTSTSPPTRPRDATMTATPSSGSSNPVKTRPTRRSPFGCKAVQDLPL